MSNGDRHWEADFPMREEVEDYAGRVRGFVINCHEGALGFTVRAEEEGREGVGYEFAAYSETTPYSALGRLRKKMYRALATVMSADLPVAIECFTTGSAVESHRTVKEPYCWLLMGSRWESMILP